MLGDLWLGDLKRGVGFVFGTKPRLWCVLEVERRFGEQFE
jgi:hypothetical protein